MTIELAGESLELRPSGALILRDHLIVADLHLGKERAFRQQGVPVPDGPSERTLERLTTEIRETGVRRVVFLGDLFHHEHAIAGTTFGSFHAWKSRTPDVLVMLVKGNHDRIPHELAGEIETQPMLRVGALELWHHPKDSETPHLAGHLHPAIRISDAVSGERLRCFWRRGNRLVLPSFSEFTGSMSVPACSEDELFITAGRRVVCLLGPRVDRQNLTAGRAVWDCTP